MKVSLPISRSLQPFFHSVVTEGLSSVELTDWQIVLICICVAILIVVTVGGNLLVLISFRVERRLQTVSNYFLLSLAVADLMIGKVEDPTQIFDVSLLQLIFVMSHLSISGPCFPGPLMKLTVVCLMA